MVQNNVRVDAVIRCHVVLLHKLESAVCRPSEVHFVPFFVANVQVLLRWSGRTPPCYTPACCRNPLRSRSRLSPLSLMSSAFSAHIMGHANAETQCHTTCSGTCSGTRGPSASNICVATFREAVSRIMVITCLFACKQTSRIDPNNDANRCTYLDERIFHAVCSLFGPADLH